jgi:sulfite oxidase
VGIQIQEMPVSSAIMSPWNKEVVVHDGEIEVKGKSPIACSIPKRSLTLQGWAYSGGGRWPERVEISSDGGYVWYAVPIKNLSPKHKFAWRTFTGKVPCDHEGWTELVVRCWDNSLNTQPMEVRHSWNWSLHVTSSCHRVKIYSVNAKREATRKRLREFDEHGQGFTPITRPTEFVPMSLEEYEKEVANVEPRDVDD